MNAPLRMVTQEQLHLRIEDFLSLADAEALSIYERTELIDGNIYIRAPQFLAESRLKMRLLDQLRAALVSRSLDVFIGVSVSMPPYNAPMPDLVVFEKGEAKGDGLMPLRAVQLIVEAAGSTLEDDLGVKLRLYAAHGVPEYWVADVARGALHQMWAPSGNDYARRETLDLRQPLPFRTLDLLVS